MRRIIPVLALMFTASIAGAQTSQPSLPPDANVDQVLDALDSAGKNLKDFKSDLALSDSDNETGDSTTRRGTIVYQLKKPGEARIRVDLPTKQVGDTIRKDERVEYVLDGGDLWDRNYKSKVEVQRVVAKPGEKIDLFDLASGPFALPIGQPKEKVKQQFSVEPIKAEKGDPADSIHLRLTPKPGTRFDRKGYKVIDVWVDRKNSFPARVDMTKSKTTTSAELTKVRLNEGVADADFALEKVEGWVHRREPYQE